MASKAEKLTDILRSMRAGTPEIIGACVVTSDGFIVASVLPSEADEELIGGMAASLLGVGQRISTDLLRAEMDQVYVRSPKGFIIVNAAGTDSSLVTLVSKDAKLGLVFMELKRTISELAKHV